MSGRRSAVVGSVLLLLATSAFAGDPPASPHLRPLDDKAKTLLTDAAARSPEVRNLIADLEHSDLVVFIASTPFLTPPSGVTSFMAASGGVRYVSIRIDTTNPRADADGWLAHELEHAVEISRAPEVRSQADVIRLYERIGRPSTAEGGGFETDEAQEVGLEVRAEVVKPAPNVATAESER